MNLDDTLERQELYSQFVLLGGNAQELAKYKPTTLELKEIVASIIRLRFNGVDSNDEDALQYLANYIIKDLRNNGVDVK